MIRSRSALTIKIESLLSIWIEKQVAHRIPLSKMVIQAKAKSLFNELKSKAAASVKNVYTICTTRRVFLTGGHQK